MEKALIHTTKGNLPVESLERRFGWNFTANSITYWDKYYLDGEAVREDASTFAVPAGTKLELTGGSLNG